MRIGVSCTEFSSRDFAEVHNQINKHFDHWEIFSEAKHDVRSILGIFSDLKNSCSMTYSIHSPICDTNIASLNERMREASVDEMISVMECAVKMDISTVTIHPGIYSLAIPNMRNASVEQARISLKQLEREANDLGIVPAIENMPNFPIMMGQTAEELGELIDGTDLKICFDIGHANTTCQTDEFIEMFKDSIVNIHIHDNNGDRDAHMTVGDGNIDFDSVLSKLKSYSGKYIIESKTFESAIASKRYLEESFDF